MKRIAFALAVAALSGSAAAQSLDSRWEFFEAAGGRNGAMVKAANGDQLVLKCDKPGAKEVHAILLSANDKIAVTNIRPISRPIRFQFDETAPTSEDWSFFPTYATVNGKTPDRHLAHFVIGLRKASKVTARLKTGIGPEVAMEFDVTGAGEAVRRVYEMCKDTPPA